MFNLLPQEKKFYIHREYVLRRIFLYMTMLAFVLGILFVLMVPSYIMSKVREKDLEAQAILINSKTQNTSINTDQASLSKIKEIVGVLKSKQSPYARDLFANIISHKTPDIRLRGLSYTHKEGEGIALALVGTAKTRESLINFQKSLGQEKSFSKIDLPISQFAKDKNLDFSISINVIQQ